MQKLKIFVLGFIMLCIHMLVVAQTNTPQSGYYWAEIIANEGGTSANGSTACFSPVAEGYRTPALLTFSEDGSTVKMSQEAPTDDFTLTQTEPGVYEYSRPSNANSTDTFVDRLTIVSEGEILREDLIIGANGGCELSDTWILTYSGEENPQGDGPLKIGAWALTVDSVEGDGCADSLFFSNISVGKPQSRLEISLTGHLIYGGYTMALKEDGSYSNVSGTDIAKVVIEDPDLRLTADFSGGLFTNCQIKVTGFYLAESIMERLLALAPSDPPIIPNNGQWVREILSIEVAENKPETCTIPVVGDVTPAVELVISDDGNTIYNVSPNGSQFPIYTRAENGNYMNVRSTIIAAAQVVSADELYEVVQSMTCGTVYEFKRTRVP